MFYPFRKMKMIKWNIYILKQRVNTIPVIKNGSDILSWLAAIINWNRKCTWSRRSQNEQTLERKMQSIQLNHAQEWHEEIRSCAKFQFKYTVLQNIFPNTNAKIDPQIRMKKKKKTTAFIKFLINIKCSVTYKNHCSGFHYFQHE